MSSPYEQQFNKQLASSLQHLKITNPHHVPVYSMKYVNASKYLIEDLSQPLGLFPKSFKLKSVYQMIERQSLKFCKEKQTNDSKLIKQGQNFKIDPFYLFTIFIDKQQQKISKNTQSSRYNEKTKKVCQQPRGKFVKLDLQMTFDEAYKKYGRDNVLTIVYTDAQQIKRIYEKIPASGTQKWLTRLLILILILIIVPYLMKDEQNSFETNGMGLSQEIKEKILHQAEQSQKSQVRPQDIVELDLKELQIFEDERKNSQKAVEYEQDGI